jgi:hypothetical protein
MTAREYFERGVARNEWNKPFDLDAPASPAGGPDPEDERDAAAVRRIIAEEQREAREDQAELDRISAERDAERRRLMEACTPAWADEVSPAARKEGPIDPTSPEAVAAREAAMDRLLAKTWPGGRG